jgi:hypothetical protein
MDHKTSQFEFTLSDRQPEIIWQELTSAFPRVLVRFIPWTREKTVILDRSSCRSRRFEL